MLNLGLDGPNAAAFYALLKGGHRVKVTVHLLDVYLNFVRDVSDLLIDGTVDLDSEAEVTRSAKLTMADPSNLLGLDAVNYGRFLRIFYTVSPLYGPGSGYTYPIFTGPITDWSKDGPMTEVECQGKEVLASKGEYRALSFPASWPKSWVIDAALRQYVGERYVSSAGGLGTAPMGVPWNTESGVNLWLKLRELAFSVGGQLFYDAWGVARIRPAPSLNAPIWTFDDSWITSYPQPSRNWDELYNIVVVTGGTPAGWEGAFVAQAVAPITHPLSPENMSTNPPFPHYIPRFIEDDSLLSVADVQNVANLALQESLLLALDVSFTAMVIPHLEEGDTYIMNSSRYYGAAKFSKATIPLVGDYTMSVGFLSTTSLGTGAGARGTVLSVATDAPLREKAAKERAEKLRKAEQARLKAIAKRREKKRKKNEKKRKKAWQKANPGKTLTGNYSIFKEK